MRNLTLVASLVPGIMAKPMNHDHASSHAKNSTDVITKTTASPEPTEFAAVLNMRKAGETRPAINASLTIPPITSRRSQTWTSTIGVSKKTETPGVDSGFDFFDRKRLIGNDGLLSEATAGISEEVTLLATASETVTAGLPLETDKLAMSAEDALPFLSATTISDLVVKTDDLTPALLNEKRQLPEEALPTDDPVLPPTSLPTDMPGTTAALILPTKAPNETVPSSGVECIACIGFCKGEDDLPSFPCLKKCLAGCQKEEDAEAAVTEQKRRAIPNLSIPSFRPVAPTVTTPGVKLPTGISGIPLPSASVLPGCQSCALNCVGKHGDIPSLLLCIERCIPVCDTATAASMAVPTSMVVAMP